MLSVIVYGRNDAHGYNLHKRVALSLNSLAHALTDPDDEIMFVDWNTPKGLPTFPVAIGDTLTEEARSVLRIVRVTPELHSAAARDRTRKVVIEPMARNAGIRRANPHNRWILSTNTDILVSTQGRSLSQIVSNLEPGYYGLPRYELPEWMWERLPRSDAGAVRRSLDTWVRSTLVGEEVSSYAFSRYDAPGDFQLVDRATMARIGAFDETMVLGWHVDSNLARRLHDVFGETRTLADQVNIHHCNHNRSETHYHQSVHMANDLGKYVFGPVDTIARSGTEDWGMRDVELEITRLDDFDRRVDATLIWLGRHHRATVHASYLEDRDRLAGVPMEVTLPFLADCVIADTSLTHIAYMGGRDALAAALAELCSVHPRLRFTDLTAENEPLAVDAGTVLVVDLTPPGANKVPNPTRLSELSLADRASIYGTLKLLDRELRSELSSGGIRRRYLVINGEANELEASVTQVLTLLPAQYYSRLRSGLIRESVVLPSKRGEVVAQQLLRLVDAISNLGRSMHRKPIDADPATPSTLRHSGSSNYRRFRACAARARDRIRNRIAIHALISIPRDLEPRTR